MADSIDMDAILAQREEATGSADTFVFTFKGQDWHCKDPITADDEWKDQLSDVESDVDAAVLYLGEEQYEKFVEAGGRGGYVILAISQYMQRMRAEQMENGRARPTRRSSSSGKRQKR